MVKWNRRRWLRNVGFGALLAPFGGTGRAADQESGPGRGRTAAQRAALAWVRFVNTAQIYYRRSNRRFGRVEELTPGALIGLKNNVPPIMDGTYEALVAPASDGYVVVARDTVSGHSFWSNQDGVIFEGQLPGVSVPRDPASAWHTFGAPIIPPLLRQSAVAYSFMTALLGFFMPTLEARGARCGCGKCMGPGDCNLNNECAQPCCNLGYQDCTWCCPDGCCVYSE